VQLVAQVGNVPCDELEWGSRVKSGAPPWQAQTQTQQIWEPLIYAYWTLMFVSCPMGTR